MARIVMVYNTERDAITRPRDMSHIRWLRMSQELARLGHQVDIATAELSLRLTRRPVSMGPNLRRVALSHVQWHRYDVVKTLYHQGFETLVRRGGGSHPFIIARLGSVVGPSDMAGIYFRGAPRERMFECQRQIHECARYLSLISPPARVLWEDTIGMHPGFLIVPGAVDAHIPGPHRDPYPSGVGIRALFSGNLYDVQPQATRVLSEKLNTLGAAIAGRGRVFVAGVGDRSQLDRRFVNHLGSVALDASWDHMHFATVGVVVSADAFMHNNESTKIYHYLRAGLPTISESGFPNDHVVRESGLGVVVANGDIAAMAARVLESAERAWDRDFAQRFIVANHTWSARAKIYDEILRRHFPV